MKLVIRIPVISFPAQQVKQEPPPFVGMAPRILELQAMNLGDIAKDIQKKTGIFHKMRYNHGDS